tara:strand:- start:57071 stop:58345 length:1275 start_codon:yes stop_codon:yes gene_type:complete
MKLKQGIDIDITTQGNNCIIEIASFPFFAHNKKPNRRQISSKHTETFDFNDPELSNKLLDFIIKNSNDNFETTYFTTKNSEAHFLLKNSILSNQLELSGLLEKKKTIPEKKKNYTYFDNSFYAGSEKSVFLDIDLFSSLRFKSTELSIAAYDTYQDLSEQQNPIFSSKEIKNKNTNTQHDYLIKSIIPHIKKFQDEGRDIQLHTTSKNLPLVSSLNTYLKDNGFKPIHFKVKKENERNKINAKNNIANHILKEYDNLLRLNDKYVIYTDGGILNEGKKNECISSGFIFTEKSGESQGHDSFLNRKKKGSNYSELYAVKMALQYVIDNNKLDKPIHIVFDSDYASQQLQAILQKDDALLTQYHKEGDIIEDIRKLIDVNNINIANTIVLKSHQIGAKKHPVVWFNERVDKMLKKEGYKKSQKYQI